MPSKAPWQSKTLWVAVIVAIAGFIPPVQAVISANPEYFALALGGVFGALRFISHGKIDIS